MSTKTTMKFFTIPEYEKEEKYLGMEHKHGWKLTHITFPCFYHFEECEPEEVVYQLDYNPDRHKNFKEYIQMFDDCGWDYVCDFVGYSFFCKSVKNMNEDEEIFNDDGSKKDMLNRVFKGRMIALFIIFGLIICPNLILYVYNSITYKEPIYYGILFMFVCLLILYITVFTKWFLKYRALKRK